MSLPEKKSVLMGFIWRIIKSKDQSTRRENTIGLLLSDFLGVLSGEVTELLVSKPLMYSTLELLSYLARDSYGRKVLFKKARLHFDLVELVDDSLRSKNYSCLAKIIEIIQVLSPIVHYTTELIELGVINLCCELLSEASVAQ